MPNPPSHHYKVVTLRALAERYGVRVFVETGTYYGETTDLLAAYFDRCITIEINPRFHALAVGQFASKVSVRSILGDSSELLPGVLAELDQPALFWLDGHYSGGRTGRGSKETPIVSELHAILAHSEAGHVIAIDDARLFDGTHDYPKVEELLAMVKKAWPNAVAQVEHDIIRILPPTATDPRLCLSKESPD